MALKSAPENPLIPSPRPTNFFETALGFSQVQQALYVAFRDLAYRANRVLPKDGTEPMEGPLLLGSFSTVNLPSAADNEGGMVFDTTTGTVKFSNGVAWLSMLRPGDSVQAPVFASSNITDITTQATMQNSSLVASITPQFSNSIIEAVAIIPFAVVSCVSGSELSRSMFAEIRNITNGVSSPEFQLGFNLLAPSAATGAAGGGFHMQWHYTVNSTATRQFRVRFRSTVATNLQAELRGGTSEMTMVLREIKQ